MSTKTATCKICGNDLAANKHRMVWCPHCDLPCTRTPCGLCNKIRGWTGTGPRTGR